MRRASENTWSSDMIRKMTKSVLAGTNIQARATEICGSGFLEGWSQVDRNRRMVSSYEKCKFDVGGLQKNVETNSHPSIIQTPRTANAPNLPARFPVRTPRSFLPPSYIVSACCRLNRRSSSPVPAQLFGNLGNLMNVFCPLIASHRER